MDREITDVREGKRSGRHRRGHRALDQIRVGMMTLN